MVVVASSGGVVAARVRAGLVVALAWVAGCREDTRIDFVLEQAWVDVDRDSGDVVLGSGASTRVQTLAYAGYTVKASGLARGSSITPIEDSGSIVVQVQLDIEASASIDLAVGSFSGPVPATTHEFEIELATFDPFLIGESITVVGGAPAKDVIRAPLLPGVFFVLEMAPGSAIPTFEGVCLEVEGGAVQYTGMIAIEPDFRYLAYIEVEVPFSDPEIIGPTGIDLDFPPLVLQELDLGTYSMSSGEPVDGVRPCGGGEATGGGATMGSEGSGGGGGSADGSSSG